MAISGQWEEAFRNTYGPWAVITGASDGIGQAMARCVVERGLSVVPAARRKERLEALAEGLRPDLAMNGIDVIASAPGPVARERFVPDSWASFSDMRSAPCRDLRVGPS